MLDTDTGELIEKTLQHEGDEVRKFYSGLPGPVLVGIEATGSMLWFLKLTEDLKIECQVGHPAKIRAAEPRKQKHDPSGCPRPSNAICAPYCGTVTSLYGCGRECSTRYNPMALANGLRRGITLCVLDFGDSSPLGSWPPLSHP
jgi:hypothetical protein